jgi:3-phytase
LPDAPAALAARPASVLATVETEPLAALGDAADDPAIWIHPTDPSRSRVLGTDKQNGLEVYDLDGKRLQTLAVGRLNNVDLRPGFKLGDTLVDLAVASQRDRNSLQLFRLDPATGEVGNLGELPTPLDEIYGLCLSKTPAGEFAVFVNDKDGRMLHLVVDAPDGTPRARIARRFALATQPEGCVVDDAAQRLFVGEEEVGVWTMDARADAPVEWLKLAAVGDGLAADIEGLAVYDGRYLIVSSQGDDSYAVFDATPPFAARGRFRIALHVAAGIDGVSETDGLDVTHHALGARWARGMLVVQDGRNRLPGAPQNFKYVPWDAIASALKLP